MDPRQSWTSPDGVAAALTIMGLIWGWVEARKKADKKKQDELDTTNAKLTAAESAAFVARLDSQKAAQDKEIELLKASKNAMWDRQDEQFAAIQKCWTRDDQEKYRMEMTNDLRGLRDELRQDFRELREHFDNAVKTIMSKGQQ